MKWDSVYLSQICKLVNGKAFKPSDWSEAGLPIIRIQNLNDVSKPFNHWAGDLSRQVMIKKGDLLIAWSGTPGTSFGAHIWHGKKGVLNQHIFRVDLTKSTITEKWLKFCVNTKLMTLIDMAHGGVGLKHVTKSMVENIQIPLPPLDEQKRIAAILDAADAMRTKRREALADLDKLVQSTFIEMFGDPVTNPKGWEVGSLQDVTLKITDGTHKTPMYTDSGIEFLSAKDLKDGEIRWNTNKFISIEEHMQLIKRCNPEPGDLLLSKSGSLGSVAVIDKDHEFSLFESLCLIKRNTEKINAHFLANMIRNPTMQTHLLGKNKGVAIRHLHLVDVRGLKILIPPLDLQHRFADIVKSIEKQKVLHRRHLAELDTLFASLQQRAFNGELSV